MFGYQVIQTLHSVIETAKQEATELVSTHAATGELTNSNLQFDTLKHLVLQKIDLTGNKISTNIHNSIIGLLIDIKDFKDQAKIHQNYIQMHAVVSNNRT